MSKDEGKLVKKRYENIRKSPNDKNLYRGLVLENGFKVLLISDPTTDKSAASLSVRIGYLNDPDNLPGLAHFLEHMLFLGTTKYPNPSEFDSFLSQYGGRSNASTMSDVTNYHFEVSPDNLEGALDRFAHFFSSPLFTESSTELELSAVQSEYLDNLSNDDWRINQLIKSSANSNHPYSKFGTGNRETLETIPKAAGIDVRKSLLKFYEDYYSADIMSLSVFGKENSDELEQMVANKFSGIKNSGLGAPDWSEHPFNEEHFQHKWYVVPINDVRIIRMFFPMPDLREHFRADADCYVAHLIGHEGEGSLLAALKKNGWCTSLLAGERTVTEHNFSFFAITMDLTEEGIQHVDEIVTIVFQYINMLRKTGPLRWVFDERLKIAEMEFNFREELSPIWNVNGTVDDLQKYPMEEVLTGTYLPTDWRPDLINLVLDHLIPQKLRLYITGKVFENMATQTEPRYDTKYHKEKIPDELIERWTDPGDNEDLKIRPKNDFIPENFDIKAKMIKDHVKVKRYPFVIEDNPLMRIWFKQDDEFLVPKLNVMFNFNSPMTDFDPINANLTYMYQDLLTESLNEYTYDATLAGLNWELTSNQYGLTLSLRGYHDKLHLLLKKVIEKMTNFDIDPKLFDIFLESHIRGLKNYAFLEPCEHAAYYLAALLTEKYWTVDELLEASQYITIERLETFVHQIFAKLHIEGLVHGNITEQEALDLVRIVENGLTKESGKKRRRTIIPLLPEQLLLNREIELPSGCDFCFEAENKSSKLSCAQVHYQIGLENTESNMNLELLTQILSQKCFEVLRTNEQLGYTVFVKIRRNSSVQGLTIVVQGDRRPGFVEQRIGVFMEAMLSELKTMSDEEFNRHKSSLALNRLEKPKSMGELSSIFWSEITYKQYNFDRTNIEVAYLRTITKDQIIQLLEDIVLNESSKRKLVIHVVSSVKSNGELDDSSKKMDENSNYNDPHMRTKITNIIEFKSSQFLFPRLNTANPTTDTHI